MFSTITTAAVDDDAEVDRANRSRFAGMWPSQTDEREEQRERNRHRDD